MNALAEKSETDLRRELRGFPEAAVTAVLSLRADFTAPGLRAAMLALLEFYLPKGSGRSLSGAADSARLREDLGIDSLTLAEAAFKLDELLGIPIETHETAKVTSVGALHALLCGKLGMAPPDTSGA